MTDAAAPYITRINNVKEVNLFGAADLPFWQARLKPRVWLVAGRIRRCGWSCKVGSYWVDVIARSSRRSTSGLRIGMPCAPG